MKTPQLLKRWWIYPIAVVVAIAIVFTVFSSGNDVDTSLRDFTDFVRAGQVTSIRVSRDDRRIERSRARRGRTRLGKRRECRCASCSGMPA